MKQHLKIDPTQENQQLEISIKAAIQLATGVLFDQPISKIPAGLTLAWNDAWEDGAFEGADTIGEMARAFLVHRLTRNRFGAV